MKYEKVDINGIVINGKEIAQVIPPMQNNPVWNIRLKNNDIIQATGNITIWEINNRESNNSYHITI